MAQSSKEMKKRIKRASKRKILRRQMELLAEYSRTSGVNKIPESSAVMTDVHNELIKAERIFLMRLLIAFFGLICLFKSIQIKLIKFIKR